MLKDGIVDSGAAGIEVHQWRRNIRKCSLNILTLKDWLLCRRSTNTPVGQQLAT